MRRLVVLAVVALLARPADAEEDAIKRAADQTLAAWRAKDEASLQELAARDQPDPWLVAEELFRRGGPACADAFGRARLEVEDQRGNSAGAAAALEKLGEFRQRGGDHKAALPLHELALKLYDELGDQGGRATALGNLAGTHAGLGDLRKALAYQEQARALKEKVGDRAGAARTLEDIGNLHFRLGDRDTALACVERALEEAITLGARDTIVGALSSLARARSATGNDEGAVAACRRAVSVLGQLASGLAEGEGARARERFAGLFDTALVAARRLDDPVATCFFIESGRAATLLEVLGGRAALRTVAIPEALRLGEADARAEEASATRRHAAALAGGALVAIREAKAALDEAQGKVAAAIDRIQREAKAGAGVVYPEADGVDEIRARLREREAMVLYALADPDVLALVLTREEARIVSLGQTEEIEAACTSDPADLAKLVAAPLGLPDSATRVLVSPAGALGQGGDPVRPGRRARVAALEVGPLRVPRAHGSGATAVLVARAHGRRAASDDRGFA